MAFSSILVSLLASVSVATAANPRPPAQSIVPGAYLVEFNEGANVNDFPTQIAAEYSIRREFNNDLFNGISIQFDGSDTDRASQLADSPAVKAFWPVKELERPQPLDFAPITNSTDNVQDRALHKRQTNGASLGNTPHVMSQVDKLHEMGFTGEGIRIAIIDDGVDYTHPALGGCFGEGCKVVTGWDYFDDEEDPLDSCEFPASHGTHVAGIVAASGDDNPHGMTGVVPDATLAVYKISDCREGPTEDMLIDAFIKAYEDGADIITSSIGSRSSWSSDPWTVVVSRIVEKGVPCTIAQGNGDESLFFAASPGDGAGAVAVSSFQSNHWPVEMFEASYIIDGDEPVSFGWSGGWPQEFDGVEREIWVTGFDTNITNDACEPLPADTPDLSEYIILVRRSSECREYVQAANVASKGGRLMVVYNNRSSFLLLQVEGFPGTDDIKAAGTVLASVGETWVKAIEAGSTVKATLKSPAESTKFIEIEKDIVDGKMPNPFNSWGPTFEMHLKPQFSAPGGGIISTIAMSAGGWGVMSGTSMATPFVAGVYALLAQARGTKPNPKLFENLLASTAKPGLYYSAEGKHDWLSPPVQQGSGLIQAFDAAFTTSHLESSSLSFNDTANLPDALNFTIVNTGDSECTYEITHLPTRSWYSLRADELEFPAEGSENAFGHAELAFSSSSVTVAAGDSVTVDVSATPPKCLNERRYPLWSGFVAVNGSDGSSLSLPYIGLAGSLHEATMVTENGDLMVVDYNSFFEPMPANITFTLPAPGEEWNWEDSIPVLTFRIHWGTPYMTAEVVPLETNSTESGSEASAIGQLPYYPSSYRTPGDVYSQWLGQLNTGEYVPAGRYKIICRILRLYGDAANEEDWIVLESRGFGIQYAQASQLIW